jgi:hypothetical protein
MAGNDVRKPALPKVSLGLGNILAQSETVVRAFGPERGFKLMVIAMLTGALVTVSAAVLLGRIMTRYLGL